MLLPFLYIFAHIYYQKVGITILMDVLYRTHDYLLRNMQAPVRRELMDRINPNSQIIGILGSRGVGKTTFLLEYAKEIYGAHNRKCLYVNLNQFFFTTESLVSFAGRFVENGGKVLLLDQIYKYPNWQTDLRRIAEIYPEIKIIYAGSLVLKDTIPSSVDSPLPGDVYTLRGFSLREFINVKTGLNLPSIEFNELLRYHKDFSRTVLESVNPINWFFDYVHHGYYPIFLEQRNYSENLLKNLNMMLEVDIMYIRSIDQKLLPKLRKLLYLLAKSAPSAPNVSQLANSIETSRATVANYMHILSDAGLITQLYRANDDETKKPAMCYLQNTNIAHALIPEPASPADDLTTFFLNQVSMTQRVDAGTRAQVSFVINEEQLFRIDREISGRYKTDRFYAVGGLNSGERNILPLWTFGFLY